MMNDDEIVLSFAERNVREQMIPQFHKTIMGLRDPAFGNSIEGLTVLSYLENHVNLNSRFWEGFLKH